METPKKKGLRTGHDDGEDSTSDHKRLRVNPLDGAGKSKGGSDAPKPDADKPLTKENLRVSNLPGESLIAKPNSSRVAVKLELTDEQTGKDNGGKEEESGISRFRQESPLQPPPELPLQEHLGDVQPKPELKPELKSVEEVVEKPESWHESSSFQAWSSSYHSWLASRQQSLQQSPLGAHSGDVQPKPKLVEETVEKPGTGHESSSFHSPFGRHQ